MNLPNPHFPRPQLHTSKAQLREQYGLEKVYRLSYNESVLGPSPKAVAAMQAAAAEVGDYPAFADAPLRDMLAETWGRGLTADHFYTASSGYETIELALRVFLQAGDEMIVAHPTFGIYDKLAHIQRARVVDVPLLSPDFGLDVAGILAAVTDKTRVLLLCNPNNPTGTIFSAETLHSLITQLPNHILIISDEVYIDFVDSAEFPDTLSYILHDHPIVMIQSFSKAYGMAGLRLGYAIAPPAIANHIAGIQRGFHQNRMQLAGGIAALRDQAHKQANVQAARDGKHWLYAQCDRLGLSYIPSQTNFFVLRLPNHVQAATIAQNLLPAGIMVRPLKGRGLDNCLRISIGPPAANQLFIVNLARLLAQKPA